MGSAGGRSGGSSQGSDCRSWAGCHRRPLRFRFDIVGAADRHGHGRLLAGCGGWCLITGIPDGKLHAMAQYGQLGQAAGQIIDAGALGAGGVQGYGHMFSIAQDRLDQAAQTGAGADLHKCPHSGRVHGFDLGHEFHRTGQLVGQQVSGLVGVVRVGGGQGVGIDRNAGRSQGDVGQRRQ